MPATLRRAIARWLPLALAVLPVTAHGHGDQPGARSAWTDTKGQVTGIGLSRGLAIHAGKSWQFVCPSQWAGPAESLVAPDPARSEWWVAVAAADLRAPAPGEAAAPQHLAGNAVHVLDAQGQWLRALALPKGLPVALHSGSIGASIGPVVLTQDGQTAWLWTPNAARTQLQLAAELPEPAAALAIDAEQTPQPIAVTAHVAGGALLVRSTPLLATDAAAQTASLPLPVELADSATVEIAAGQGAVWSVIRTPQLAEVALLRVGSGPLGYMAVYRGVPQLTAPVVRNDAVWLVEASRLGRVASWPGGPAAGAAALVPIPFAADGDPGWFACLLPSPLGTTLGCTRTQVWQWPAGAELTTAQATPVFVLAQLKPPDLGSLTGSLRYGCWLEWLDVAADAGLDPGDDPDSNPPPAPAAGCTAGRTALAASPTGWQSGLYLLAALGPLLRWLRRSRQ